MFKEAAIKVDAYVRILKQDATILYLHCELNHKLSKKTATRLRLALPLLHHFACRLTKQNATILLLSFSC